MEPHTTSKPSPDDFPRTAADWQRVLDAAPGENRPPTARELAQMQRSVVVRTGGPQAVRTALTARRLRGAGKKPAKQQVTLRIEQETLARWRASGSGWQTRIAQILAQYAP